jgi:hypothetical protein
MKKILFLLLLTLSFSGCEKDDICEEITSVTPRVIIEFYDFSQPTLLKNVVNLEVHTAGEQDTIPVYNGVSKIKLPLNPIAATTTYTLNLNSTIPASANTDILTFNYTTKEVFISRACGFKNIYELTNNNFNIHFDATTNDGKWIRNLNIETKNIETENETHIKIYF